MHKQISSFILAVLAVCCSDSPAKAIPDILDGHNPVSSAISRIGVAGLEYITAGGQRTEIRTDTLNRRSGQTVSACQLRLQFHHVFMGPDQHRLLERGPKELRCSRMELQPSARRTYIFQQHTRRMGAMEILRRDRPRITGGVHGMGAYVVDDPDFGLYAYGGRLESKARSLWLFCDEACARMVSVTSPLRCGVEFRQDALDPGRPFKVSRDGKRISFSISNRYGAAHKCMMTLTLPAAGTYSVKADGKETGAVEVSGPGQSATLSFTLKKGRTKIQVVSSHNEQ